MTEPVHNSFTAPGLREAWLPLLCGRGVAAGVVAEECLTVLAPRAFPCDPEAVPFGRDLANHRTGTVYDTGEPLPTQARPRPIEIGSDAPLYKIPGSSLTVTREWAESMGYDVATLEAESLALCGICQRQKPKRHSDSWEPHNVCEDCYWELP